MLVICEEKVLKALLNALLIADVRIDFVKDGELGTVRCRNAQAALAEQGKKSARFSGKLSYRRCSDRR